ncbi:MAG: PAS domain S-box protein [Bacteroidales bacterium]|nr:PAS domain S-box protein [Bacteroidales bacterium]
MYFSMNDFEFAYSRQSALIDALPEIIMEVDENKVYTWCNRAGLEFFGPDVLGHEASYYFEGEQDTYHRVEPVFNGLENSIYVESWQRRIDGEKRLLAWYCNAIRDREGKVTGAVSSARDITELVKTEEALKHSEERYRLLVENSDFGVGFYSLDGKVLFFNTKAIRSMGGKPEDYIGKNLVEIFGQEAGQQYLARIETAANSNLSVEYEDFVSLETGDYWFLSTYSRVLDSQGSVTGIQIISHDITQLKKVQIALKESEEKYKKLVELSPDAIVVHTLGKIVFANPAAYEKMGARSADDLLGKNAIDFVHPDYRATALARIKNIYENHQPAGLAHEKFIRPDGQVIDVETTAIPFVYDGKPAIQLIIRDITDKIRLEQDMAESELKFRTLFESSHDALFLMTGEKFTECNQTTLAMFGCTRNEILNHTPFDFSPVIQPDGTPSEIIGLRYIKSVLEGSNQAFEWLHLRRDGTSFDAEVMLNRIVIAGEKYIQASVRDISQRKADEDKLRKSEARYRLLSDNMTDMVWLMDLNLVPLYVSPSIEKVRGFAFEELKQLKLEDNLTPESLDRLLKIYHAELPKVLSDVNYVYDQPIDLEYYKKDGSTFWLEIIISVIRDAKGAPVSLLCVGREITAFKKTLDKLRESEEQLNLFFSQSLDGFFFMMLDQPLDWKNEADKDKAIDHAFFNNRITKVNKAMADQYGLEIEEIIGYSMYDFFYHDVSKGKLLQKELFDKGNQHIDTYEKKRDGEDMIIEGDYICIYDEQGRIVGNFGIQRDVTADRKAKSEVQASELQLKFITHHLPVGIAHLNAGTRYKFVNQAYCEMMHMTPSEIIGKQVSDVMKEEAYNSVMPHIERVLSGKMTEFELITDLSGSSIRNYSVIYIPETDHDGNVTGFIATITDITARKETEKKIQQQLDELQRWQQVTLGREDRIMELKREVNDLLLRLNEPVKYKSQENKITDT